MSSGKARDQQADMPITTAFPIGVSGDSLIVIPSLLSMIYLGSSQPLTEPGVTIYFSQALKTNLSS